MGVKIHEYPIKKCKTCDEYNHEKGRMYNKLRCMVDCEELRIEATARAIAYNLAASDGNTPEYEMGSKVLGYDETHGG
jgi:hypothetical protein